MGLSPPEWFCASRKAWSVRPAVAWRAYRTIPPPGGGQGEENPGPSVSAPFVTLDPPAMGLDDRLTNGQAHAHPALLGREKAIEQLRQMIGLDAGTAVLDAAAERAAVERSRPHR